MENNLLEFYKKNLVIDPEISQDKINECYAIINDLPPLLKRIYCNAVATLDCYIGNKIEYFNTVSGNRAIITKNYAGVLDNWFPSESSIFSLCNPILSGWIVEEIAEKGCLEKISDFSSSLVPNSLIDSVLNSLINMFLGQDLWGFWMGDLRNNSRRRPVRLRRVKVIKCEIDETWLSVILKDHHTKEEIVLDREYKSSGWNFYFSRDLLEKKLSDLEVLWTRNYDTRVHGLDLQVASKRKELENLIRKRENLMNGISEYRENIKKLLWTGYSTL